MSQKANPTLIGAFVFGAILIAVAAVVFFGSANLFTRKQAYVTYFDQSVSGLSVGSSVKLKGVTVGNVTKVVLDLKVKGKPALVKVFYEVDPDAIVREAKDGVNFFDRQQFNGAVQRGLRAKLDFESLISGQLYISIDFVRGAPSPVLYEVPTGPIFEIPAQPSDIDAILANLTKAIGNLGNIDFLAIAKDLQNTIVSIRQAIESMKLADLSHSLTKTADSVTNLASGDQLKGTLSSIKQSFDQLSLTLKKVSDELDPISANLNPTLEELKKTMSSLQTASGELNKMLLPTSGFRYQLDGALSEISNAAGALQQLSDFLQRNPNSIIFGRKPAKK